MLNANPLTVEQSAAHLRSRALKARARRTGDFAPPEWPKSRGPTPHPRRS